MDSVITERKSFSKQHCPYGDYSPTKKDAKPSSIRWNPFALTIRSRRHLVSKSFILRILIIIALAVFMAFMSSSPFAPTLDSDADFSSDDFSLAVAGKPSGSHDAEIEALDLQGAAHDSIFMDEYKTFQSVEVTRQEAQFNQFLLSMPPNPSIPVQTTPNRIYSSDEVASFFLAERLRYVKLTGFSYCSMLNNSVFDALVAVLPLGGSIAAKNPAASTLTQLIDDTARAINAFIKNVFPDVSPVDAKRYACYAAAEGNNPSANLTDDRLLVTVDPEAYFSPILPSIKKTKPISAKPRYLIAYMILVSNPQGINQLSMLLDVLDDGNAIILLQVDKGVPNLIQRVERDLKKRERQKPSGPINIHLSSYAFTHVPSHISTIFANLNGFWELADLADWDFVINLSTFDWPLRNNENIYHHLKKHPGAIWIDYWSDSKTFAQNALRPHFSDSGSKYIKHPPEVGITSYPFPHWSSFKQMEWMILSRDAVNHMRFNRAAVNFLAFMEHTSNPEETFFINVLYNSKKFRDKIICDKKRYVRSPKYSPNDETSVWIGWSDRYIFNSLNKNLEAEFFFMRPFNALGEFFGETKLLEWIRVNHLEIDTSRTCYKEQLGYRDECISTIVSTVADKNTVILVPVNEFYMPMAANLRCSLRNLGIRNIVFWSIDIHTHDKLSQEGYISYFEPTIRGWNGHYWADSADFVTILRTRAKIILQLLEAGFNVVSLDADTVVRNDFRETFRQLTESGGFADILAGIDEKRIVAGTSKVVRPPNPNTGIMYFRNTSNTKLFLKHVMRRLAYDKTLRFADVIAELFAQPRFVVWTGIGLVNDGNALNKDDDTSGGSNSIVGQLKSIIGFGKTKGFQARQANDQRIRVHYLDQFSYMSGPLFFEEGEYFPIYHSEYAMIHANGEKQPDESFKSKNLWFLAADSLNLCIEPTTNVEPSNVITDGDVSGDEFAKTPIGHTKAALKLGNQLGQQQIPQTDKSPLVGRVGIDIDANGKPMPKGDDKSLNYNLAVQNAVELKKKKIIELSKSMNATRKKGSKELDQQTKGLLAANKTGLRVNGSDFRRNSSGNGLKNGTRRIQGDELIQISKNLIEAGSKAEAEDKKGVDYVELISKKKETENNNVTVVAKKGDNAKL